MSTIGSNTRVLAIHRSTDTKIIGVTIDSHDFSPGSLSELPIRVADSKEVFDMFSVSINCNEWRVYELKPLNP